MAIRKKAFMLRFCLCVITAAVALTHCTSFQSPKTLDPGEVTIGAGLGVRVYPPPYESEWFYTPPALQLIDPEIFARFGIAQNFDVGISLFIAGLQADVKWQLFRWDSFMLSLNAGAIVSAAIGGFVGGPTVAMLLGSERFWGAVGTSYVFRADYIAFNGMLGAAFGSKFKVIPTVSLYYLYIINSGENSVENLYIVPGIGFQYTFGG